MLNPSPGPARLILQAALVALSPTLAAADLHFINEGDTPVQIRKPGGPRVKERSTVGRRLVRAGLETHGTARPVPSVPLMPLNDGTFLTVEPGESALILVPDASVSKPVHFVEVASEATGQKVLCALHANGRETSMDLLDNRGLARMTAEDNRFHFAWADPAAVSNEELEAVFIPEPEPGAKPDPVFVPAAEPELTFVPAAEPEPAFVPAAEPELAFVPVDAPAPRHSTQATLDRVRALLGSPAALPTPDPVHGGHDPEAAGEALAQARKRVLARRAERSAQDRTEARSARERATRRLNHHWLEPLDTVPEQRVQKKVVVEQPAATVQPEEAVVRNQGMMDFYSALY